jgi:hypothetical protein
VSAYRVHESAIRDHEAIIEACCDRAKQLAIKRGRSEAEAEAAADAVRAGIELHLDAAAHLHGYKGDAREELAHVVVPRAVVNQHLGGGCSNDVGFARQADGTYSAIVSDYDRSAWWNGQTDRFWQLAQAVEAERAAMAQGCYYLKREEVGGIIRLTCESR